MDQIFLDQIIPFVNLKVRKFQAFQMTKGPAGVITPKTH